MIIVRKRLIPFVILLLLLGSFSQLTAQNYTSISNGNWTTASVWNNTSGWGGATPPVSNQGSGTITVNHDITIGSNYNSGSATLNVSAGKILTINGDLGIGGGGTINVSGTLIITGNANLNSVLNILPGGAVYVLGTMTVSSDLYLRVGTNVAGPPYADLIVLGNLASISSGDILVNRNGRVAVSGNLTGTGGGTFLTIANGGQAYVGGNVQLTGNGSAINNSNTTNPYGLYVDGTITNSGGGSTTTSNTANEATMQATNPTFSTWVSSVIGPLPVEFIFFKALSQNYSVLLEWATASERNANYFVLEKSHNGRSFIPIDTIESAGNSSIRNHYSFIDNFPLIGKNYYRLKQVDIDGQYEYSDVVVAEYQSSKKMTVYPTLLSRGTKLTIQFNFTTEKNLPLVIYNAQGSTIAKIDFLGSPIEFHADLPMGIYYIKTNAPDEVFLQRFVVQ